MNEETPINTGEINESVPPADETMTAAHPPAAESGLPDIPETPQADGVGTECVPPSDDPDQYPPRGAAPSEQLAALGYRLFRSNDAEGNYPPWGSLGENEKRLLVSKATEIFSGIAPRSEYERCVATVLGLPTA